MTLKILGRASSSNVQKVLWLVDELALPYERVDVGGPFGQNQSEIYLALNPNGMVPTLIDRETVIWESNSILRYLCNRYVDEKVAADKAAFYPQDATERSHVERWMDWQLSVINAPFVSLFQAIVRTAPDQRDPVRIEAFRLESAAHFALLDRELQTRDFAATGRLSLADMALGPTVHRWFDLPIARPSYPSLQRWYERLLERPAYREHVAVELS